MKLLNHTLSYSSVAFFLVIGIWATFLYLNLLDEIYDSIDDGLENSKILIIQKERTDSTILHKTNFMESNYAIREITPERAAQFHDTYMDSTLYMVNEEDYEPVRMLKTAFRGQNGKYYQLNIVSSMVEEDDLIEDLFYSILWLYGILLASILLINNVLLKRIWKPFHQIVTQLKDFNLESARPFPDVQTKVTEFKVLNDSVASLLNRLVATYSSQKQFIENASHELQTPLAISINKLELLAERETFSDNELQEITSVIESLERLTRLNKTLLLLSKIENRQFPEVKTVTFNEVADKVVAELSDLADYKSVTVVKDYNAEFSHTMNAELATMMVSNLLKNAIVHNAEGGSVTVTIGATSLTVTNSGNPEPLDASQVFKRFYKGTSSKHSTGLGLAIVKSITDYYGLNIQYTFNGMHMFTISRN